MLYRRGEWITERRLPSLLLIGYFLLMTGCGSRLAQHSPWWGKNPGKELQANLDGGNRLFREGDYSAAAAIFQNLRETGDQDVLRPALYGLACSRLMLADSRQEYLEAVEILELWQRISPPSLKNEDPRMLLLFLAGEAAHPDSKGEGDKRPDSEDNFLLRLFEYRERIKALEDQIAGLKKEIAAYEKQKSAMEGVESSLAQMEAANKAMKGTLKEKEDALRAIVEELSTLRDQIKTLETIDQEIQEKKQGISSP